MNPYVLIVIWGIIAFVGLIGLARSRRRMNDIFEEIRGQSLGKFTYHPVRHLGNGVWEYAPDAEGKAIGLPNMKMTVEEALAEDRASKRGNQ